MQAFGGASLIRLRGLVFTINFLATLGLWVVVLLSFQAGAAA
ncbi:hypothetical protein ACA097_00730 [Pseudomonas sp. QL9]